VYSQAPDQYIIYIPGIYELFPQSGLSWSADSLRFPCGGSLYFTHRGRVLCDAEIAIARTVFADRIDYSRVRVVNGKYFPLHRQPWIIAPNGHIYWPGECGNLATDEGSAYAGTLIHEMTHVMQYQSGQQVLLRGFLLHAARLLTFGLYDPYRFTYVPGKPFEAYNLEQQAEVARHIYFGLLPNIILQRT
jgi:hypothetical protein